MKVASSNLLLKLDNRFLRAGLRAFENRPGPISLVLKSSKYISNEQFSFEKSAAQHPPLLKGSRTNHVSFKKLSANAKAFSTKWLRSD
jgi:hypothetical protein